MNIFSKLIPTKKVDTPAVNVEPPKKEKPFEEGLISTKDIIAPAALEVDTDFIRMGGKYYRTVFTVININ